MARIAQIALFAGAALAAPAANPQVANWGHLSWSWGGRSQSTTATSTLAASTSTSALATSTPVVAPTTSTYVAPSTSATPSSTYVAPTTTATPTSTYVAPTTSSTPAPATTQAPSATVAKRGVAYNTASLAALFTSSPEVGWAYNWGSSSSGLTSDLEYVPLLWGTGSDFTPSWSSNAQAAINAGSTHLMSFNEPDESSQANLSPADAAAGYLTYMEPFAGKAKLGAPAVTNGGSPMGLTYLGDFMTACSTCTIDYVVLHWYGTESSDFISHVEAAYAQTNLPIWITEFGLTSGTDDEISAFLETVMAWMDSTSYVERYAYFMASEGVLVNAAGTGLSDYGSTYATYTS